MQGQADLAATSLDAMLRFGPRSVNQGARLVFGLTAAPPVALLVPTSQAQLVKSINDLPGTKVGLSSPGAPEHAWFGWLLARAGLSIAQVSVLSHGTRGLVGVVEGGDVHAGLVPEPFASRLIADGRATVLVDLRTPAGVMQAFGVSTVNAAVFARADRRPRDASLTAFARAVLAAEQRIATASVDELAARLPQAADDSTGRVRRAAGSDPAHLPGRRAGDRRPAPRVDRAGPGASAAAGHRARTAARGADARRAAAPGAHRAGGALTGTPKAASSRAVSSSGKPTTFEKDPSRPATSAPPRPWMA